MLINVLTVIAPQKWDKYSWHLALSPNYFQGGTPGMKIGVFRVEHWNEIDGRFHVEHLERSWTRVLHVKRWDETEVIVPRGTLAPK